MSSQTSDSEAVPDANGAGRSWLLLAGTFLTGCALGAVVMGVGNAGSDGQPSGPAAAPTVATDAEGGEDGAADDETPGGAAEDAGTGDSPGYVRVPKSCAQTADDVSTLLEQVDDVVAAVGELDAERLRQAVDDVQQVRDEVQDVAEQCQQAAAQAEVDVGDAEGDAEGDGVEDGGVEDDGAEDDGAAVDDPPPTPAS